MRKAKAPINVETEHVTTDDIFTDLGFSPAEAVELTIKSDLHRSLLERIQASKMTQVELAKVLDVHQPDVSNLLRGKLSLFSITKLCQYAIGGRLGADLGAEWSLTRDTCRGFQDCGHAFGDAHGICSSLPRVRTM